MSEDGKMAMQANKSANVIKAICELYGVSLQEAVDAYYQSDTSELIEDGVADFQCRSDKYLATIIGKNTTRESAYIDLIIYHSNIFG